MYRLDSIFPAEKWIRTHSSEIYKPPFTMTEEITNLIVEIGEYVGTITTYGLFILSQVLQWADNAGDVAVFVEFMLGMIRKLKVEGK